MIYEFEGKTEREAIELAAAQLGLETDEFDVEILESLTGGLFKKGKVKIRVHTGEASPSGQAVAQKAVAAAAAQTIRPPVSLSASLIAVSLALSLAAGGLASYFMARRMAKMKPADILRQF